MHHFSVAFLERMAEHMRRSAPFHQARKIILSVSGPQQARPAPRTCTGCSSRMGGVGAGIPYAWSVQGQDC